MANTDERQLAGLRQAMRTETTGHHFYKMAAMATEDPRGREVFEQLAEEELTHLRVLQAQLQSLTSSGRVDPALRLGAPLKLDGPDPIFSPALRARLGQAHYEMTALAIGIQLEIDSQRFYSEQAASTADPQLRAFFQRLSDWEAVHYHALLRQHDSLKEDYWAAGGFQPF